MNGSVLFEKILFVTWFDSTSPKFFCIMQLEEEFSTIRETVVNTLANFHNYSNPLQTFPYNIINYNKDVDRWNHSLGEHREEKIGF